MKLKYLKYCTFAALMGLGVSSCENFLDSTNSDNFNESHC